MAVAHSHRLESADLCLTYSNSAATYACHDLGEKTLGSTRGVDFAECVRNYHRICGSLLKGVNWGILQMASCLLGSRQPEHGTHAKLQVHSSLAYTRLCPCLRRNACRYFSHFIVPWTKDKVWRTSGVRICTFVKKNGVQMQRLILLKTCAADEGSSVPPFVFNFLYSILKKILHGCLLEWYPAWDMAVSFFG